jgi:NAD(P)-dependent dehydrogenase (short-subunit alcohol dehydrogenase family)
MTATTGKTALIIGASRGLGYALAAGFLARGWQVTATVRSGRRTDLHELAKSTLEAQAGKSGLQYLDYQGRTVRW